MRQQQKVKPRESNVRPESAVATPGGYGKKASRRPQTAGRTRVETARSSRSSRQPSASSNYTSKSSRSSGSRPQSSPLVRHGVVGKRPEKLRSIAGYRAPDLVYDEGLLAKARHLNAADLKKMSESHLFRQACLKSGCKLKAVFPKPVSSFLNVKLDSND